MYLDHFALARFPFEDDAPTDDLFLARAGREAGARLRHLFELRGVGLLTGEAGCGKTALARAAAQALHPTLHRILHLSLHPASVADAYRAIAVEFGVPPGRSRSDAGRAVRREVARLAGEAGRVPILILDDAHNLSSDALEGLRLLADPPADPELHLRMLLVGLSELRRRIALAVHEPLAQRLVVRHHVRALQRDEIDAYLAHRLRRAACERPLFEPPAVETLLQSARGLPRAVNRIAHYALVAAAIRKRRAVDAEDIRAAVAELKP